MSRADRGPLIRLRDMGETIEDPRADIRGRMVIGVDGQDVGTISALIVDHHERKVRFLQVSFGGFLGFRKKKTFIPVGAIVRISSTTVRIDRTEANVVGAPRYDPEFIDDLELFARTYRYYGMSPFWGNAQPRPKRGRPRERPGDN